MAEFNINDAIRITTRFYFSDRGENPIQPTVSYSIYSPVNSVIPAMAGQLTGNNLQQVNIKTLQGMLIRGELSTTLSDDQLTLKGYLYYGTQEHGGLQNHFNGIVAIGAGKTPPTPAPPPPILPPQSIDGSRPVSTDLIVAALLYPYINLGKEVTKTSQNAWLYFVEYNASEAPATSLYSQLIAPAQTKDRSAMEDLAITFLQNQAPEAGQYFDNLVNIPDPFRHFPVLYDTIAYGTRGDTYENTLLKHLNFNDTEELKTWAANIDTAVADQVWQNYFSLTIIGGYNAELFIQLNKIILVHNLLQKLYVNPLPSFITDREAAFPVLLKATVMLPDVPDNGMQPVFPLPPYVNSFSDIASN